MVLVWFLEVAITVLGWFVLLFSALPVLTLPSAPTLTVPVPLVNASEASALDAWFDGSVAVALAVIGGRLLDWLYARIPLKGT